jgi:hypothetical protein
MTSKSKTFIKIDGWGEMNRDILVDTVKTLKDKGTWDLKKWRPTPALIDKSSKTSRQYVGQNYDQKYFDLIPNGWTHDHCEFCTKRISNKETYDDCLTQGYNLDNDWICEECYNLFMTADDIEKELEKYQKVEK